MAEAVPVRLECINAVTLATTDMARSMGFYSSLGFPLRQGSPDGAFTTFDVGSSALNLQLGRELPRDGLPGPVGRGWGRVIIWVDDVDAMFERCRAAGIEASRPPSDAPWGERYFHLRDPDGHEISFAQPLEKAR